MEEIEIKYQKPNRTKIITGHTIQAAYKLHDLMKQFKVSLDELNRELGEAVKRNQNKNIDVDQLIDYVRSIESTSKMC